MSEKDRLYDLDNLKVFLVLLVIVHHVGQADGATGGAPRCASHFRGLPGGRRIL